MKSVGSAAAMSNLSNIRIYDIFRKDLRLPDEKAFELVQAIDDAVKGNGEDSLKDVATKAFVREEIALVREEVLLTKETLRGEIASVRDELHSTEKSLRGEIASVRDSLRGEIASVRDSLKEEIASVRNSLKEEIASVREVVQKLDLKIDLKATQTKNELLKAIFWSGIVQFLAIVGSMIAIFNFMLRK